MFCNEIHATMLNNWSGMLWLHEILDGGDYELSMQVARKKNFQKMHAEEPGTEEAVDGVKYGPCKFDLAEAWAESRSLDWEACAKGGDARVVKRLKNKPSKEKLSWEARKVRLYHVLRGVARRLHKKNLKVWIHSCGRFVSQKLGPIPFLKKKGIIHKIAKEGQCARCTAHQKENILDVSQAGGKDVWALRALQKKVPRQIEEMMNVAESQNHAVQKVPRTVEQVEALLKAGNKVTQKKKAKKHRRRGKPRILLRKTKKHGSSEGYVKLWFLRARVSRSLHRSRRKLQLKKATVAQLARVFPDSYGWCQKFSKELRLNPQHAMAQTLFNRLGYTGEPETFSMWCCLFADPALTTVSSEELVENAQKMEKFALAHRKKHKIWPHPAQAYVAVQKKNVDDLRSALYLDSTEKA